MRINLLVDSSSKVFGTPINIDGEAIGEAIQLTDGVYSCASSEEQYTAGQTGKNNQYTTEFQGQLVLVEIPDDPESLFG